MLLSKRIKIAGKLEDWHNASISDPNQYAETQDAFCFNNFCQTASGKIFAFNDKQPFMAVSTDDGKHWTLTKAPNDTVNSTMYNSKIKGIQCSFYDTINDRIYVGARNLMYSDDDGVTWNVISGTSITSNTTNQYRTITHIEVIEDRIPNSSLCTFVVCIVGGGTYYIRCSSSAIPTYLASNALTLAVQDTVSNTAFFHMFNANNTVLCTIIGAPNSTYIDVYNISTGSSTTKTILNSKVNLSTCYYDEDTGWLLIGFYCTRNGSSPNYTYTPCREMLIVDAADLLDTGTPDTYTLRLLIKGNSNVPYLETDYLCFNSITKIDNKFFICVSHQFSIYEDYDIGTAGAGQNIGCVLCADLSSLDHYGSDMFKLEVEALDLPDEPFSHTFKTNDDTIIQGTKMVGSSSTNSHMQVQYGFQLPTIYHSEDIYQDVTKYKYLDQAGLQEIHNQIMDYISEVTQ